jgi:hypothetical protein
MIGLLHDVKRVIQQQGYPRLDIAILWEKIQEFIPDGMTMEPDKFKNWVDEIIGQVNTVYSNLQPDQAYVHMDTIEVRNSVGTMNASGLGALEGIIQGLERQATRALKTNGLLFSSGDGAISDTNANRQWETHVASIKAIQHLLESQLEKHFNTILRAAGIQATVEFRFAELRAAEMLRDEQTKTMKYSNIITAYDQGWISQNEAALEAVGHKPDQEEPRRGNNPFTEIVEGDGDGEEPEDEELDNERYVREFRANGKI